MGNDMRDCESTLTATWAPARVRSCTVTETDWELRMAEGRAFVSSSADESKGRTWKVRELCVQFKAKSIIQYTGLVTKDPSRGGHDSAGAHLRGHQVSQESAKRRALLLQRSQ